MTQKVTYLRMQGVSHIPGVGQLDGILPSSSKSFRSLNMSYTPGESVIRVEINGVHANIPLPNIQLFLTAPEEESAKKSK